MFSWWSRKKLLAAVSVQSEVLPAAALQALAESLLRSPFLQANVLNARFSTTQGFSVIFQDPADLLRNYPETAAFLDLLQAPQTNLYYLNVLAIGEQGCVERHVDHSIRGYDPRLPLPQQVSVLYVQVPPMQGGALLLYDDGGQEVQRLLPCTGMLIHFPGQTRHAVEAIRQTDGLRLSLVCEQYRLKPAELQALPHFTLKSTAGFEAYLQRHLP